jgi:hypothetical protein
LSRGNGRIVGDRFLIRRRFNFYAYNTADFEFVGQVQDRGTGSVLSGLVGPNELQPVIMGAFLALTGFFELMFCILALDPKSTTPPFSPVLTLIPLGMAAFGILLFVIIVSAARSRWRSTETWLMDLVSASPA